MSTDTSRSHPRAARDAAGRFQLQTSGKPQAARLLTAYPDIFPQYGNSGPNDTMHIAYRIAIADGDPSALATLRATLLSEGHEVVAEARSGEDLIEACARVHPQIVITDANLGPANNCDIVQRIVDAQHIPIIIVADSASDEAIEAATVCRPMAYLVKPVRDSELRAAIVISMQRFNELASMRQSLEDRKIVERAKGIIMRQLRCDETSALHQLQKLARDHRQKLIAISQSIILAEHAFTSPGAAAGNDTDASSDRAS